MQPTGRRRAKRGRSPEQHEVAVVERFVATGRSAAVLAQEFDIPEATVRAWIDRAAEAALEAARARSSEAGSASSTSEEALSTFEWELPDFEPEVVGTGTSGETSERSHHVPERPAEDPASPAADVAPARPRSQRSRRRNGDESLAEPTAGRPPIFLVPSSEWFGLPPVAEKREAAEAVRDDESAEAGKSAVDTGWVEALPVGGKPGADDLPPAQLARTDGGAPPAQLLEMAVRSVANGSSLASVARWFNVSEPHLHEWIAEKGSWLPVDPPQGVVDADADPTLHLDPEVAASVMGDTDTQVDPQVEAALDAEVEASVVSGADEDDMAMEARPSGAELPAEAPAGAETEGDSEAVPEVEQALARATETADAAAAARVQELAVCSVANGSSRPSMGASFGAPEPWLEEWFTGRDDRVTPDRAGSVQDGYGGGTSREAEASDAIPPGPPEVSGKGTAAVPVHWLVVPGIDDQSVEEMPVGGAPGAADAADKVDGATVHPERTTQTPPPSSARYIPTVYSSKGPVSTMSSRSPHSSMSPRNSLQVIRRRLLIVVVALILGATAGWVTAPGKAAGHTTFQATHTLIYEPQGGQNYSIDQVALLATSGAVPSRVAARLQVDRSQVRSAVSAVAESGVDTISITARSSEAAGAVSLAEVTAEELVTEIAGGAQATYQAELNRRSTEVDSARKRLNAIPPKNVAEQAAARGDLAAAERSLQQYQSSGPPKPDLRTLESASATAVAPPGVQAPNSKKGRALLLGLVGLLAGLAGAVALDRVDSRIRSKGSAEEAFGAPVIAEVPSINKSLEGQLLTRSQPTSAFVEAYRGLRTYIALWAPKTGDDDGHRVIVVTSPSPNEGKTTTVAHLAAMLAEIGRSVLVVSADLRRPRLHQYFDMPGGPGLIDALAKPGPPVFTGLDQPTSVRGVRLVPSGAAVENPAPLFEHAGDLLRFARGLAEFVLVDAPPLLVANDAVEMARYADGVLLIARAGQTPIQAAERSAEILERLEIPVVGAVLVASEEASSASRYYGTRYYAERSQTGRLRRRPAGGNGQRTEADASPAAQDTGAPQEETPVVPEDAPPAFGGS
jgi:Mrp family chromosome partitioning ATPase